MSKVYRGVRNANGYVDPQAVTVYDSETDRTAPLAQVVWHSPSGFEWGYGGSGPADLALSILADVLGEQQSHAARLRFDPDECPKAVRLHQRFKWEYVSTLPCDPGLSWEIHGDKVLAWTAPLLADEGAGMPA